jgi:protein-disulfide isomerase
MTDLPPVTDRDHTTGPAEAAVTLMQYGDFECPFSRQVHLLVREVRKVFPQQIRFVFRHFPLRHHNHALHAAIAAEAAGAQGAFWPMHERLFSNQLALSDNELVMTAEGLGLDAREVKAALQEGVFKERVLEQKRAAVQAGMTDTLNLVIDGALYQGDAAEDALIERVIRPLKDAEG